MSRTYETVLVIGAEKLSAITDWTDRNTCVLFGDGAGAVVLEAVDDAAIRRVVARWRAAQPTLAALGPLSGLEAFESVRDRFAA